MAIPIRMLDKGHLIQLRNPDHVAVNAGFVDVAPTTSGDRFIPIADIPLLITGVNVISGWLYSFNNGLISNIIPVDDDGDGLPDADLIATYSLEAGDWDPNLTPVPADGDYFATASSVFPMTDTSGIGYDNISNVYSYQELVDMSTPSGTTLLANTIYTVAGTAYLMDSQEEGDNAPVWNGEEYIEHDFQDGAWVPLAPASADYRRYTDDAIAGIPQAVAGGGHIRVTAVAPVGGGSAGNLVMRGVAVDEATLVSTTTCRLTIRATGDLARIRVDDGAPVDIILAPSGDVFQGTHDVTLGVGDDTSVKVTYLSGDVADGGAVIEGSSDSIVLHKALAPVIQSATLSGSYPISSHTGQPITALPASNTSFTVSGTADKPVVALRILDQDAAVLSNTDFAASTSFSSTVTIANRGDTTQALPVHVQVQDENAAWSAVYPTNTVGSTNGVHVINLNNSSPSATVTILASTGNQALKDSEAATVSLSALANTTMTVIDPIGDDIEILSASLASASIARNGASTTGYNITTNNLSITLINGENGLFTSYSRNVKIAHAAPIATPSIPPLPSSATGASHTWDVAFNQQVTSVTIEADAALGDHFSGAVTQPTTTSARRVYQALDASVKGQGVAAGTATNLAGKVINFNIPYSTKGYVARDSMVGPDNQLNYGVPKGFFVVFVQTTYDMSDAAAIAATKATHTSDLTVDRLSFNNETGVIVPVDTASGTFVNSGVRVVASGDYDSSNPPLGLYSLRDGSGNALADGTPFTLFEIHDYADINGLGIPAAIEGIAEAGEVL